MGEINKIDQIEFSMILKSSNPAIKEDEINSLWENYTKTGSLPKCFSSLSPSKNTGGHPLSILANDSNLGYDGLCLIKTNKTENTQQTSINTPFEKPDIFWEKIASNESKFDSYLTKFDYIEESDKCYIKEKTNQYNADLVQIILENTPKEKLVSKVEKFSTIFMQMEKLTPDKTDSVKEIIKTKPEYYSEYPGHRLLTYSNMSADKLALCAEICKIDSLNRLGFYEVKNISELDMPPEKLKCLKAMLESKNKDDSFKCPRNYEIKDYLEDKKLNTNIIEMLVSSPIEIKDGSDNGYKMEKIAESKNTDAIKALLEIEGVKVDNLYSINTRFNLSDPSLAYTLNSISIANKKYPKLYKIEDSTMLLNLADKTKDTELMKLIFDKDMQAIEDKKPNSISKFLGAKPSIPGIKLVNLTVICKFTNKNNKDFIKNYLKENIFKAGTAKTCSKYFNDKLFKDIKNTMHVHNANEILSDDKKLEEFYSKPKKLRTLYFNHPEIYKNLETEGVILNNDIPDLSDEIFEDFGSNSSISENLMSALTKKRSKEPWIKKFSTDQSEEEILKISKLGDVVEYGDGIYVNEESKLTRLNISKNNFERYFDPVKSFDMSQGKNGNCYQVAVLDAMMNNPKSRIALYKSFKDDKNIEIEGYKKTDNPVEFKNYEPYKVENKTMMGGSDGLKMLEQAYAVTHLEAKGGKNVTLDDLKNSNDWTELMKNLSGGNPLVVFNAYLGNQKSNIFLNRINEQEKIEENLGKLSKGNALMCFSTVEEEGTFESELNKDYDLVSSHAYSIKGYDLQTGMVQYSNPYSAGKVETVHLDLILPYISMFYIVDL